MSACPHPTRPCRIHDTEDEQHMVIGPWVINALWGVLAVVVLIALSTVWGLN